MRLPKTDEWEKGPGMELFRALHKEIKELRVIAEDLGFLTESVLEMLKESGFPGMKVLQFAFDGSEDSSYLPYNMTATVSFIQEHMIMKQQKAGSKTFRDMI